MIHNKKQKFNFLIFLLLYIPLILLAQIEINLPKQISVYIGGKPWQYSHTWLDSLKNNKSDKNLKYKLGAGMFSQNGNIIKLEIPQILNLNQVLHQVIYYYCTLEEDFRPKEKVLVYPFFSKSKDKPSIECKYTSNGKFHFTINKWEKIPIPSKPADIEISIYNQILNNVFRDSGNFNHIPQKYFKNAVKEHNLSEKEVKMIFQKVTLWKSTQ